MFEALALSLHLLTPPDLEWSAKKRLLRERTSLVVRVSNRVRGRADRVPHVTFARLRQQHGEYDRHWDRIVFDLESVHDPAKFWHVYRETVLHEWAHALNARLDGERGHGEDFRACLRETRRSMARLEGDETSARHERRAPSSGSG